MGQRHGKAVYDSAAKPFLNLSLAAVGTLWETFNDVADGFGINLHEFLEICSELGEELQLNRAKLDKLSTALFKLLDTDNNGLIDAIEFVSAMACASGMSVTDTLEFVLNCYDFDGTGRLTIDEISLAFKSTVTGMCKLEGTGAGADAGLKACPRDVDFEAAAMNAFERRAEGSDRFKVKMREVIDFCQEQPEIRSWLDYFDDPAEEEALAAAGSEGKEGGEEGGEDNDIRREGWFPVRTTNETAVAEDNAFSSARAPQETTTTTTTAGGTAKGKKSATATPPWMETVKSLVPASFSGQTIDKTPPDIGASLEWIHGYNGSTCRNNVRYSAGGEVIYHACRACVSYNATDHRQRFNLDHTDDICSFAMHPSGRLAATGEVGTEPKIIIWDTATMQTVKVIKGFHRRAVTLLAFSENGALLASVGQDDNHCLAVHDWEKGKLQHTGPTDMRAVLGCCFEADGGVVTCGDKHALFWKKERQCFVKKKGVFGRKATAQMLICCSRLQGKVITGAASGHLYVWSGRNCVRSVRGHYGSVTAMFSGPYGLISGGKDMRVRLWSPKMEPGATFDMSAFGPCPIVHSLCLSNDGTKLLVGVKGCEIYEVSAADGSDVAGGPVTTSHFDGQLTGLARHPQRAEYATAGSDGTVRIWDALTRSLLRMTRLDSAASCVDYSPDGELLIVGFGARNRSTTTPSSGSSTTESSTAKSGSSGSKGRRGIGGGSGKNNTSSSKGLGSEAGSSDSGGGNAKTGGFIVLNEADFITVFEARDAKQGIIEVRWSPDRDTVVLGGEDSNLYLYATGENYDLIATAAKHKHPVTSVDFSKDGDWIRSTCKGGQLHIWDTNKGNHQSNITKYKDVEWSTETCAFTWATRGIFTGTEGDGARISCTDRSPNGLVVAVGDGYSRLRLYRHPCPGDRPPPALFHELRGHGSGGVSRARFLRGGEVLVTLGESDRCVLQWKLSGAGAGDSRSGELKDSAEAVAEEESDGYILDLKDGSDLDRGSDFETAAEERRRVPAYGGARKRRRAAAVSDQGPTETTNTAAGTGFDGGKASLPPPPRPWEQATVAPSRPPPTDKSAPADGVELERIHGYRGRDSRSNAVYAGADEVGGGGGCNRAVYTSAAAGVSLDLTNHTQNFQLGHSGDATCLAALPDGLLVATGDVSRRPTIIVWKPDTGEAVKTLSGFHRRAITALSFSRDGRHLASLGCDDDHSLAIYDWENSLLRATAKGGRRKALDVAWNSAGTRLVTCGLRHVSFWNFAGGRNLLHSRGVFGGKGRKQTLPCCVFVGDTAVVGTGDGHLYVFENGATTLTRSVKAHTGSVYTLHPVFSAAPVKAAAASDEQLGYDGSEGQGFWSGGKDGLVKFYNGQLQGVKEFSVATIASNGVPGGAAGALKALAGGGGMGKKRLPGAGGSSVSLDPAVRSVFTSRDGRKLLVGTRGGELYEMSTADGSDAAAVGAGGASGRGSGGGPLTAGHGRGQVWGLSAHPTERLYATCGDDGSVRIWSLDDRRVVGSISTDCSCRAICYSPDGSALAVGCGGGKGKADATKSGTFLVLKSENLSLRHEGKDADDWIRDVNYSSDGARLAVASNDCKVYIYATKDGFTKLSTIASHQSFVTHVDFSSDGNYVQSADGASSLLFADAATGIQIPSATAMKDIEWGTWTLPFGWAARGVWPIAGNDPGTEISCARRSGDSSLLAAGDNFGRLRVFKYPVPIPGSCCSEYRGHCAAVRRVCWSAGDTHLLSCGVDGSVMQWRMIAEPDAIDSGDEAQRSGEDSELEGDGGLRCCSSRKQPQQQTAMLEEPADAADPRTSGGGEAAGGDVAAAGGGETAAASVGAAMAGVSPSKAKMPWVAAMVPPSNMKMSDTTAPELRTRLDAVHGCRAEDLRGCVWYNHEEGIVYPVAALCVIYDPRTGRQSYHESHLGDVISLTVSSCRRFAASGDAADPPLVHVWDAVTGAGVVCGGAGGETSGLLPSLHRVGVALLAFSCDGHWLASMGHDPEHTLAVYTSPSGQWWDAFPVATAKAGFTRFLCLVFTGQEAFPLLAGGIKTVSFFDHTDGSRGLRRKRGVFGFRKKIQPVLCAVKMGEDQTTLTGTVTGNLYSWKAHRVHRSSAGHAGPVYCCARAGVKGYLTAGKDGFIMLWDAELQKLKQYGVFESHPASAMLHSICSVGSACKFVTCTRAGEVYEISKDSGRLLLLADGHGKGQLRGLATHPTDPDVYATVGDDAFVRVWSLSLRRATLKMKVDSAARSLAFSPSGKHLVVGLGGDRDAMVKEGAVIVLSAETLEILEETP
ncbi:conserved unknown protein [Ectocarpus siliculosus]|uniref:EF-hand domain-containing protein n=1 Tax=Ectocarpus siliculosus TaxID=2880 RepID=D7FR21_ECTSI|nr:conserved unknown protein [Ectocarpus siliculosus]|eukprot:CBJ26175.1 conserved unknown protein [Ectocarpus siliculosus]